jgi:hypothetical protein
MAACLEPTPFRAPRQNAAISEVIGLRKLDELAQAGLRL